jgi:hypothetical protein
MPPPLTIPTFIHNFYECMRADADQSRFRDLPAYRGFVNYQVRFLTSIHARCKGYQIDEPETIARLNVNLRESDFRGLRELITALGSAGLLAEDHVAPMLDELARVREVLYPTGPVTPL